MKVLEQQGEPLGSGPPTNVAYHPLIVGEDDTELLFGLCVTEDTNGELDGIKWKGWSWGQST